MGGTILLVPSSVGVRAFGGVGNREDVSTGQVEDGDCGYTDRNMGVKTLRDALLPGAGKAALALGLVLRSFLAALAFETPIRAVGTLGHL